MNKELILVADDTHIVLSFTSLSIKQMGFDVVEADNGIDALELIFTHNPALAVLDWKMPGIDGIEVTKAMKADPRSKDIPVIMITGFSQSSEELALAMETGVNEYIRKPFDRIELEARIRSQLKQYRYLKEITDLKNNELNQKAIELALNLEYQDRILTKLENLFPLIEGNTEAEAILNELLAVAKLRERTDALNGIQKSFSEINSSFSQSLLKNYPELTPAEIKLCMLLRMNLSTKEIAVLTFQAYDSVRVSRSRLRDKLNIDPSENLVNYLMRF